MERTPMVITVKDSDDGKLVVGHLECNNSVETFLHYSNQAIKLIIESMQKSLRANEEDIREFVEDTLNQYFTTKEE